MSRRARPGSVRVSRCRPMRMRSISATRSLPTPSTIKSSSTIWAPSNTRASSSNRGVTLKPVHATVTGMSGLDLESIARSVVKLRADVPEDAFTAGILGSQRTGNGVVIDSNGLILTIGYLVTEATDVGLSTPEGRELAGHPLAYDQVTGFGLVLPLEKADMAPVPLGSSADLLPGDEAYV